MQKPITSYSGSESYIFVCYAHRDAAIVYPDLVNLDKQNINIWYDEGISAGTTWRGEIAAAIKGSEKLLFYISKSSLKSGHCLREVDYALDNDIEILPIFLDGSQLPDELQLSLNRVQALYRNSDPRYHQHLISALSHRGRFSSSKRGSAHRRKSPRLAFAAAVLVISAGIFGYQYLTVESERQSMEAGSPSTTAFDRYLTGLELWRRWDKDGNLDRAIAHFEEATALDPNFALAFAQLSEAQRIQYRLTGDETFLQEAETAAEQGMQVNPNLAPVQLALGKIQLSNGNTDLAVASISRAFELDPNNANASQALADIYALQGRTQEAEATFRRARALEPENLFVLNGFANFLLDQSRFEEAVEVLQDLVQQAPDHYAGLVNLGSALTEAGRVTEAIPIYERATSIQPSYIGYASLAAALGRVGRYEEAVTALENALVIEDTDWLAWGNLGYVYSWMEGRSEEARQAFNRAIELGEEQRRQEPRDPFYLSYLALYYAKLGNRELALQRIESALSLAPNVGEILATAAETHELLGNREQALSYVQAALNQNFPAQQFQRNPEFDALITDARISSNF